MQASPLPPCLNRRTTLKPQADSHTQQNVTTLKGRGVEFVGPDEGLLSCGYEGVGRLAPVEQIVARAREMTI